MNKGERYVLDKLKDVFVVHLDVKSMVTNLAHNGILNNRDVEAYKNIGGYVKQTTWLIETLKGRRGTFPCLLDALKNQNKYLYSRTLREKTKYDEEKRSGEADNEFDTLTPDYRTRLSRIEVKVDHILGAMYESRDFTPDVLSAPLLYGGADVTDEKIDSKEGYHQDDDVISLEVLKSLALVLGPYHNRIIRYLQPQWYANEAYRLRAMSFEESTVIGLSDWRDNTGKNATWKNLKSIVRKSVVYAGPVINRLEALRIIDHKTDGRIRGIAINLDSNIEWKILGKYLGLSSVQLLHIQADNLKFGALNMAYNMLLSWISTVESVEEIYPLLGKALKLADRLDLANIVEIWITESQPSSRDMTPIDEEQSESDSKVLTGDDDPSYNGDDDDNKDQNENDGEKKNEEEENERDEEEDQESEADIPDDHDVPDVNDKRDDDNNYDDDFFDDDGDNDNLLPDDSNDQRDKSPDSKNG